MGRKRSAKYRDLPEHCYAQKKGKATYYRYRHPTTGKYHSLGTERKEALRAARVLNNRILSTPSAERLVAKILVPSAPFAELGTKYLTEELPGRNPSPKTVIEYRRYTQRAIDTWGDRNVPDITRRDVAAHLEPMTPNVAKHARSVLMGIFAYGITIGWLETNPVEGTAPPRVKVARHRLEEHQYALVKAQAPPWLQHAMDVALLSLQRREDLTKLTAGDLIEGALHVRQGKTGMRLRIRLWAELGMLMRRDGPIIQNAKGKPITPEYFSRAFQAARDKVPELAALPAEQRPSLHELRSLGGRLLKNEGIDPQALLGHIEAKTTRMYLDRYEETWVEI
jgi:enterobacteria phage integrase